MIYELRVNIKKPCLFGFVSYDMTHMHAPKIRSTSDTESLSDEMNQ